MSKIEFPFIISLHKYELCEVAGITPYQLRVILEREREHLEKLGYNKNCKLLMPSIVEEIAIRNKLKLDFHKMEIIYLRAHSIGSQRYGSL